MPKSYTQKQKPSPAGEIIPLSPRFTAFVREMFPAHYWHSEIVTQLALTVRDTGFTPQQICGKSQFPEIVKARHDLWFRCLRLGYSSTNIADAFGCNSSTIRHAYRKQNLNAVEG